VYASRSQFCAQPTPARSRGRAAVACLLPLVCSVVCSLGAPSAAAQVGAQVAYEDEEPLLPDAISELDVTLRARFARQWRQDDGTLVVLLTGGFQLDMGQRRLSAVDAVVWITPRHAEDGRKFYELTVYLSEEAEVREIGGSTVEDRVLLVSNIRTSGRITKLHDAHSPEVLEDSDLYQRAVADRARIEALLEQQGAAGTEVVSPEELRRRAQKPARVIFYRLSGGVEPAQTEQGDTVFVATNGVYFSQTGTPDAPALVIQAQNAVIFPAATSAALFLGEETGEESDTEAASQPIEGEAEAGEERPVERTPTAAPEAIRRQIRGVYLEGDVVLTLGERVVRASRLYYDFEMDRALMLDAVFRTDLPERGVPLYVRADEIRQLSAREFSADKARVSTSEFYTPHYHVGAERIYLRDRTARDAGGRAAGPLRGEYELRNATLNVENWPLLWWPYSQGDVEQSETLLRRIRTGYSSDKGVEFESAWYLFNLLGLKPPPGYDATLKLDYFSDRGPAAGVDVDYETAEQFGLFRSYYVNDHGEDNLGPLRRDQEEPDNDNRGRVLWRHRHYLPNDWEVSLEFAYASDPYYLEEWEKSEWFEGKDQESAVYLKRAKDVDAITLLANWRTLDFETQTEHLPELVYRRLADTFLSPVNLYHESRVGSVRYKLDDRHFVDAPRYSAVGDTDVTFRTGFREEAELPLKLPGLNAVPFSSFNGYFWDGMPLRDGSLWRGVGVLGVRGGGWLARVFDEMKSDLFDINRVRHIIQPHFVAWWSASNLRSEYVTPFDEGVETIDDFYGAAVGVKQTWQTKRGAGDKQRTVDLLTLDLEIGGFGSAQHDEFSNGYANPIRPEDSRSRNYASLDLVYRLSDTTSFLYDLNFDLNDGKLDRHDISLAVERNPRLSYVFGYRHAGDIDSDLIGGGYNYKLNEKHITSVRIWYDLDRGELGEIALIYIRKLPRWYVGINLEFDEVFDEMSVSVSMWPEGIPEWTLGSRRFTGLATSTGIKP
jgi:hypothetical protein